MYSFRHDRPSTSVGGATRAGAGSGGAGRRALAGPGRGEPTMAGFLPRSRMGRCGVTPHIDAARLFLKQAAGDRANYAPRRKLTRCARPRARRERARLTREAAPHMVPVVD